MFLLGFLSGITFTFVMIFVGGVRFYIYLTDGK